MRPQPLVLISRETPHKYLEFPEAGEEGISSTI